jgi:Protein of unknown function (DUF1553)/Protein of unknown function (DUF1549)
MAPWLVFVPIVWLVLPGTPQRHWAFQPPVRPALPSVRQSESARNPIDLFINAELEKKNTSCNPSADRATLLRRVSFDLTGLPPTPAERERFLSDARADAYERMVEHYLASPHYGERWGKYWLDAAGYADSNGYFSADSDRPLAYRYRDYVIRSLNQDKPYDVFFREQIAGDEMAGYRPDADITGRVAESLTATHFLRNAPDGTGESDGNPDEVRTDRFSVLEGTLHITMSSLLGVTIQCARCHDHKFEPISQEEYYRLQAIFFAVYCPDRWVKPNDRELSVGTVAQRETQQRIAQTIDQQIKALKASLESITGTFREQLAEERLQATEPAKFAAFFKARKTPEAQRTPEQKALLASAPLAKIAISDDDLVKRFPEYARARDGIREALAGRERERPTPLPKLSVLAETDPNPPAHHVLVRGRHNAPGREVQPGVPAAFCTPGNAYHIAPPRPGQTSTGRRLAFARWVTSPENPLFARVMVNRIWQHHFGAGLVATSENLGQSGARPSHPQLLDYLATEFIRSGWSIKAMHRLILSSAAYRQSSAFRDDGFRVDPGDRLLWRYPSRRLDAEAIRDAMLSVSGELDATMNGPYVPTPRRADGNVEVDESRADARRRSVYLQQRRTQVATLLELFDAPSISVNCTVRNTSTVPLQSLALLNSDLAILRAKQFASRLEREVGGDFERRLMAAFQWMSGRDPDPEERTAARRFFAVQRQHYRESQARPASERGRPQPAAPLRTTVDDERRTWADLCQMLLASNAFLYIE